MKISLVPIGGVIQYNRKDCVWVKDDDGHDYIILKTDKDLFNLWLELGNQYWNSREYPADTYQIWMTQNEYNGPDFNDYIWGASKDLAKFLDD